MNPRKQPIRSTRTSARPKNNLSAVKELTGLEKMKNELRSLEKKKFSNQNSGLFQIADCKANIIAMCELHLKIALEMWNTKITNNADINNQILEHFNTACDDLAFIKVRVPEEWIIHRNQFLDILNAPADSSSNEDDDNSNDMEIDVESKPRNSMY